MGWRGNIIKVTRIIMKRDAIILFKMFNYVKVWASNMI